MDLELTFVCYICGNSIKKQDIRRKCNCKNRVCRDCWKFIMCIDCFDKLPYDKKELINENEIKYKKRGNIIKLLMFIMFPLVIFGFPIFEFPPWTMMIFGTFLIVFPILFYIIPLIRLRKKVFNADKQSN